MKLEGSWNCRLVPLSRRSSRRTGVWHYATTRTAANSSPEEIMRRLNRAYRLLIDYCASYRYTFREEDVARAYPAEQCVRRYAEGWFDGP